MSWKWGQNLWMTFFYRSCQINLVVSGNKKLEVEVGEYQDDTCFIQLVDIRVIGSKYWGGQNSEMSSTGVFGNTENAGEFHYISNVNTMIHWKCLDFSFQ